MKLLRREPVRVFFFIRAGILCAVSFGLRWEPEQIAAVMLVVEAAAALYTREIVTPYLKEEENGVRNPEDQH